MYALYQPDAIKAIYLREPIFADRMVGNLTNASAAKAKPCPLDALC